MQSLAIARRSEEVEGDAPPVRTMAPYASPASSEVVFVINGDAGTVRRIGPKALRQLIARNYGSGAKVVTTDRHDFRAALLDLGRDRPGAVAVLGGDGTARSALETLTPHGVAVAPLPGGTMNRIAARVYGRASLQTCLAMLRTGAPQALSGASVGSHRFYIAAGFGAWMQMQAVRERFRGDKLAATRAMAELASRQFACRVAWAPNGAAPLQHSALVVGVGRIDHALGIGARRHEPSVLEAAGADVRSLGDLSLVLAAGAARRWRRLRQITTLSCRSIHLEAERGGIPALLDGEHHLLSSPAEVKFDAACGLVWAPAMRRRPW